MTDKEEINSVFRKITFAKITFILFEGLLIYSLFKNYIELAVATLSCIVVMLIILFIDLWEAINKERLKDYDR